MEQNSSWRMPGFNAETSLGTFARGFRGEWSAWRPTPALQPAACDQECLAVCDDRADDCDLWCVVEERTPVAKKRCQNQCERDRRACARRCGC
jgi:hypothetical protein